MRLGYACIALSVPSCSTAKTVPLRTLAKLEDSRARHGLLERVARQNLENTLRLLWFNRGHHIRFYRFSSQLVPMATHEVAAGWDWEESLGELLGRIGTVVKENGFRVGSHPGQHTVVNAPNEDVFRIALWDLGYHEALLTRMGLDNGAKMVVHVGGGYGDPGKGLERFAANFDRLPAEVQRRLVVENDDRIYGAADVLALCRRIGLPMVFDAHHHRCVNRGEPIRDILPAVFETWKGQPVPPKVHFSSPKSPNEFRMHADNIDPDEFRAFLDETAELKTDFDVMLEAKNKDQALLALRKAMGWGEYDPGDGPEAALKE